MCVVSRDVRSAAAAATADFAVNPEGREILRREGALRPLVLLVEEGIESPAAEQAAKALMTLAASDINKASSESTFIFVGQCSDSIHILFASFPYCLL